MVDVALKAPAGNVVRMIDWVEKAVILVLFIGLLSRISATLPQHPYNVLLLVSDGIVVVMMLLRRRTQNVSPLPMDWLLAVAATP